MIITAATPAGQLSKLRQLGVYYSHYALANGVQLTLHFGKECKSTGRHIWLPDLPDNADQDLMLFSEFILYHELGHVFDTDFDYVNRVAPQVGAKTKGEKELLHSIHNILEDPRVELSMCLRFPGMELLMLQVYTNLSLERKGKDLSKAALLWQAGCMSIDEVKKIQFGSRGFDVSQLGLASYTKEAVDLYEAAFKPEVLPLAMSTDRKAYEDAVARIYSKIMADSKPAPAPRETKSRIIKDKATGQYGIIRKTSPTGEVEVELLTKAQARDYLKRHGGQP